MNTYDWLHAAGFVWLIFLLFWFLSARKLKSVKTSEPRGERLRQMAFVALAYVILFNDIFRFTPLGRRLYPCESWMGPVGFAVALLGVAFAIWARWHLGANWSATVTLKHDHELIRSGPYRWIRHPIYTGMLSSIAGVAFLLGEIRGYLAFFILFFAFYSKARKEERFLTGEFGEEFREHLRHTGMFLPKLL